VAKEVLFRRNKINTKLFSITFAFSILLISSSQILAVDAGATPLTTDTL
jgi:hypothetical protein